MGAATLSMTTFSIMTLSIKCLYVTLCITLSISDTQHNNALRYAECNNAECHVLFIVMLSVVMLNVVAPLML
jgi:hypothetical protein